jgi:bile acid:Na+ symporter, BASS family
MIIRLTQLFPLWAILLSLAGYWQADWFASFKFSIIPLLSLIMFGMGMSLKAVDFKLVLKRPKLIAVGILMQFLLMPFIAWGIAILLSLPPLLLAGMVLVGSSPGGTASNVIAYLAKGNLALSITLTSVSTLIAVIATPYLTLFYAGQVVPVDTIGMLFSIFKIVLIPVFLGVLLNTLFGEQLLKIKDIFPLISVIAIVFIIAIVVALNAGRLAEIGLLIVSAVMLHNLLGLVSGYSIAHLLGYDKKICRTLSIEVGMQNSGLAVALASNYFGAMAALPGALFSIWHNLSGSALAAYWNRQNNHSDVPSR